MTRVWELLGIVFGIACAVLLHLGILCFGGVFIPGSARAGTTQEVELVGPEDASKPEEKKEEKKEESREKEELEAETEEAPDAAEILRSLEISPVIDAPALDAASLGAIEQALEGGSAFASEFASALSFNSGGRIGGTGKAGGLDEKLEKAFSLSEIDQQPRVIFQSTPLYPKEMRGKEGVVKLIFVVDANGRVENPKVVEASDPAFSKPAIDAVKQWKFEPAVKGGQRVACKMRAPLRFQPSQ